ncbi:MAG TPA: glucan biosynthesis protein G [Casimicrobiaceae bacterium]|nr:glucan biosynthesis protein G [Casimicrobiaceae bacterium]
MLANPRLVLALLLVVLAVTAREAQAFGFEDVAARARQLAAAPYRRPDNALPKELQGLTYDQYRDIRFRPDKAYWHGTRLPFELMFFHQGLYYEQPVGMHELVGGTVRDIRFDSALFDYGANQFDPKQLRGLGFAGFRVHYALNTPKYKDEVLVFLGASYFRALGKGQRYGLSARGLALDTGVMSGEEFPRFTEFWIQRPEPNGRELTILALLESPRAAGAYRFVLRPGVETVMDIHARLFMRENVTKLGLAPLTSMFFYGENSRPQTDDYRPEVHDSDGLSVQAGSGEWLWRPLVNPRRLLVTSFATVNPLGFGLQQRDREWADYQDLEARYDLRPSGWIETRGKWGAGRVELVQIPTPDETNDNIVAYWVPDAPPPPKQALDFEYRLLWQRDPDVRPPLAWVTQTRRGHGYMRKPDDSLSYVIDFEGPALKKLSADAAVEAVFTVDGNAELIESNTYRNEVSGGWRATLRVKRLDEKKPVELRAFLRLANATLSETWSYVIPPT